MKKVLIVSADRTTASGHAQNIGDAFLTDALSAALRAEGLDVVIADFGVADRLASTEKRARVGGFRGLASLVRSVDAVVLGGGTLLADDQPDRRFAGLPRLCAATALLTRMLGKKFIVFGVGVDPVSRRWARMAIGLTLRLGRVWIRDEASAARAATLMRRAPRVCGDVSLFTVAAGGGAVRHAAAEASRTGAVVALNRREAAKLTVSQVEVLEHAHGPVRFLSMDQGDDADGDSLAPEVVRSLGYTSSPQSWQSVYAQIAGAETVLASRMHAMYMGVMAGVPVVALAGAAKVDAFISEFHVASVRSLDEGARMVGTSDPRAVESAVARLEGSKREVLEWIAS